MKLNIMCVGNSLLHHPPCESVMWDYDWGMAASCRENDYFHVLQRLAAQKYPDIEFSWYENPSISLEKGITKNDNEDYMKIFEGMFRHNLDKMTPDVVLLQLGDNCPHESTSDTAYAHAMISLVDYLKSKNPDVSIVLCLPWYGELIDSKHIGTLIASRETGFPFVDLTKLFCPENQAHGLFEHNGVQNHPGDRGMELIAKEYLNALSKIVDSKLK